MTLNVSLCLTMFVNVFEYEQWDISQSEGVTSQMHEPSINYLILTCIATGKSWAASAGTEPRPTEAAHRMGWDAQRSPTLSA